MGKIENGELAPDYFSMTIGEHNKLDPEWIRPPFHGEKNIENKNDGNYHEFYN